MSRAAAVTLVALALTACGKSHDKPGPAPGSGSARASGSGRAAAVPPGAVAIFVDGAQVAVIDAAKIGTWPRIDGLVPEAAQRLGTWKALTVDGATTQVLPSPADRFPGLVPALYPAPDGAGFGMFDVVDLAKKASPKGAATTGVRAVRIELEADSDRGQNEEGGKASFDPAQLEIAIKGGTKAKLTGLEIIDLPREAPPNGDTATQGWKLQTFLAAAGITTWKKLLLTDAAGTTLTLTPAEMDPAKSVPYFKLNRQGQLRLRLYTKEGDGWVLGGNLRGLASIEVLE